MKYKISLILFLISTSLCCFSEASPKTPRDSALLDSINKKINAIKIHQDGITDTLKGIKKHIAHLDSSSKNYIVDSSAINKFIKQKDAIYQSSGFICLSCNKVKANHVNGFWGWTTLIISALIFIGMWYYGIRYFRTSTLCRDDSDFPIIERPYSFARVQLFWWTILILSLYIYFFAFTGVLVPFNMTSVVLLGAGVLVYSGGKIIDQRQQAALGGNPPPFKSENLLYDIMSDETGVSIHRFQTVIFNLILGVAYVIMFLKNISECKYPFPDFEAWQFALLGISAATYLGNKTTENTPEKIAKINQANSGGTATAAAGNNNIAAEEQPTVRDIQNH